MKVVGISAGRKNGNNEILLKHAMLEMQKSGNVEAEIIRLADLHIDDCIGCEHCMKTLIAGGDGTCVQKSDDMQWLLDEMIDADSIIVAAPVYDLLPSGNLITLLNRALGVGKEYREKCKKQRKICAAISIGGSDWIDFVEPVMNLTLTNLSKDAIVVDRLIKGGYTAPAMVLLDDDLLNRAAQLGKTIMDALNDKEHASYHGSMGICPGCHCNVIVPQNGLNVTCAFCKAKGKIKIESGNLAVDWDEKSIIENRFTKQGEIDHQADISRAHKQAYDGRDLIAKRKEVYLKFDPVAKPER